MCISPVRLAVPTVPRVAKHEQACLLRSFCWQLVQGGPVPPWSTATRLGQGATLGQNLNTSYRLLTSSSCHPLDSPLPAPGRPEAPRIDQMAAPIPRTRQVLPKSWLFLDPAGSYYPPCAGFPGCTTAILTPLSGTFVKSKGKNLMYFINTEDSVGTAALRLHTSSLP